MSNALFTFQSLAHYQFLDGYVSLAKWHAPQHARFEAALALPDGELPSAQMREDRALLVHEITHFLDATTTTWGLELACRKINAANRIKEDEALAQDAVEVLMLNLSEIGAHYAIPAGSAVETLTDDLVMVHQLVQDRKFGVLVLIHFQKNGEIVHTVPLSMLSLLEAHAYANETLLCMLDARRNSDADVAAVDRVLIAKKLIASLASPELSEYTVLIRLVRLHFPALDMEQQLELVVALARFCLDVDSMTMSLMSNSLGFVNAYLGDAMTMDLRRGASRAVLFMKTIFGLYGSIESGLDPQLMDLLRNEPRAAIARFWRMRLNIDVPVTDEFNVMLDRMPNSSGLLDEQVFKASARHNRALLAGTSVARIPFAQFLLLDCLLGDLTPVRPPNRMNINVEAAVDANLAVLGKLQSLCADDKVTKFYMGPDQAQQLLVHLQASATI